MKRLNYILALLTFALNGLWANPQLPQQYSDRILIAFTSNSPGFEITPSKAGLPVTGIPGVDNLLAQTGATGLERWLPNARPEEGDGEIRLVNIYRVKFGKVRSAYFLRDAITRFAADKNILYAESEHINYPEYSPNDTRFGSEWHLPRVQAPRAWDLWNIAGGQEPGSRDIILASVDSGVQYTHPDLKNNIWINQDEIPAALFNAIDSDSNGTVSAAELTAYVGDVNGNGTIDLQDAVADSSPVVNGVDDDSDGYTDDIIGWDVSGITSGPDPDRDPMAAISGSAILDVREHGTHVAGLLAAETDNGTGVASAIFNGLIMPVKCLYDQDGNGYISGGYSGILYAAQAGADLINLSWGSFSGFSSSEQAIINTAYNTYGVLIVAAAGNGNDNGTPNNDPHYPSAYNNVVSVTAVGPGDNFSWATYGPTVDLSAPGEGIWSTVFTTAGAYNAWAGTSMASPLVASCFGLLKSMNPGMTNDELVNTMLNSADPIDDINPTYAGGLGTGRINVYNAIAHLIFPRLEYSNYSLQIVNDDGDGQLSAGETAWLRVVIQNAPGWVDALDVSGILTSSSPYVTILDSVGSYGTVQNGNIGTPLFDRFQFAVSTDAPSGNLPFSLHLVANEETGHPYETDLSFEVEISMWQPNFPIHMRRASATGNAVIDINNDGIKEIIFAGEDSLVHAVEPDGSELIGFPVLTGGKIAATPAVGDVDNDGSLDIVIGSWDKKLYLIHNDGSKDTLLTSSGYLMATPTLVDLDGDGDLEIIQPGYNQELVVLNYDGSPVDSFPITLGSSEKMTRGAAVADLNGDGNLDIIVGTWGNRLHAFQLDGTEVEGFPVLLGDRLVSDPVVANIDNAGGFEIIVGSDADELYAVSNTGEILWTFDDPTQNIRTSPAVGDLNGDGQLEICFTSYDRKIYALDNSGTLLSGWPVTTESTISSSPVLADIDNDGSPEIFVGSDDHHLYGLVADGSDVSGFPIDLISRVRGTPTVANIDTDGDWEVIVTSDSLLAVVDIKSPSGDLGYWPTARGNWARTGVYGEPYSATKDASLAAIPTDYKLNQNYPNPFNPLTVIGYEIPQAGHVYLRIYDITGREVESLVDQNQKAGKYRIIFTGNRFSSGIYFYKLDAGNVHLRKKMLLVK